MADREDEVASDGHVLGVDYEDKVTHVCEAADDGYWRCIWVLTMRVLLWMMKMNFVLLEL